MKIVLFVAIAATLTFICSCENNSPQNEIATLSRDIHPTATDSTVASGESLTEVSGNNGLSDADNKQEAETPADKKQQKQQPPAKADPVIKTDWDKKIIKTATINVEIKDYNSYYAMLREKIKDLGGYVAQEQQQQSDYKIENTMIIKVPVDQFDLAVARLSASVEKITERKISTQDVTTEVVDTKSRIEAKKRVRQRYMELMDKASNMQDILSVQQEINGIQEEIESATGRVEYLRHASVFSTIHLTYYQVLNPAAHQKLDDKPSFGDKLNRAVVTGWEIVSTIFIAIVTIWPLILGSFFLYLLYKKLRVQRPKQAS